jgi:hypothetical protein
MRFHIDPPLQQPVYFKSEMKSLQTSISGTGSLLQIYVTHITAQIKHTLFEAAKQARPIGIKIMPTNAIEAIA